jgi:hypothetical protein
MASAQAAPSPADTPCRQPYLITLRMQIIPIGPTGAAVQNPSKMPFSKKTNMIIPPTNQN